MSISGISFGQCHKTHQSTLFFLLVDYRQLERNQRRWLQLLRPHRQLLILPTSFVIVSIIIMVEFAKRPEITIDTMVRDIVVLDAFSYLC